ncbi:hypothetical protein [Agromyces bauzanensis]
MPTEPVAKLRGGAERAARTIPTAMDPSPAMYPNRPAARTGGHPSAAPSAATTAAPASHGSARAATGAACSSARVRSIVGQSVTRVPATVSPTQPSRLTSACESTSPSASTAPGLRASHVPSPAPTTRNAAAAT